MREKFVPLKVNLQSFLSGENPNISTQESLTHLDTLDSLQRNCVLIGNSPFVVQCALICDRPDLANKQDAVYEPIEKSSIKGVLMHVFNTHDHSSRLFTIEAQSGVINWDAMRSTIQRHTQAPHAVSAYWENANGVSETQIHNQSTMTRKIAEALVQQMAGYTLQERREFLENAQRAYDSSTEPTEGNRMRHAIVDAVGRLRPDGPQVSISDAHQAVVKTIIDPAKKADWMLSNMTDVSFLRMREQWTGNYARLQQQGMSPEKAGAIAMIQVMTNHMQYYERFHGNTISVFDIPESDYTRCAFVCAQAVEMAHAAGCSKYEIGRARNPDIVVDIDTTSPNAPPPTTHYLSHAARVYSMSFSQENQGIANMLIKFALDEAPGETPNEKLQYAMDYLAKSIERSTGETPPSFQDIMLQVNALRSETTNWGMYAEWHSGNLTPDVATRLREVFIEKLFEEGASRSTSDTATLAIAMHKAARNLCHSPELQGNDTMQYHLSGIAAKTLRDMSANGMDANDMHNALDNRDDVGDDDIGDDAF